MAPGHVETRRKNYSQRSTNGIYKVGGLEIAYDPDLDQDKPQPEPLFPVCHVHCNQKTAQVTKSMTEKVKRNTNLQRPRPSLPRKKPKSPTFEPFAPGFTKDPTIPS